MKSSVDFETYRDRIEPIFLKTREGGVRCYDCHSVMATRLRLEPLSPESSSWTPEQSRLNFKIVSDLITPGNPMKSRLLLHPLSPQEGGDPTHTGGKFWKSKGDPEWRMLADWVRAASQMATTESLTPRRFGVDFNYYKTAVEPLFLKERPGHARCYGCHVLAGRSFHLEPLSAGTMNWTDEQSRRNFQSALQQIIPGDPTSSRLLMHPLATRSRRRSVPFRRKAVWHRKTIPIGSQSPNGCAAMVLPAPAASAKDVTRILCHQ